MISSMLATLVNEEKKKKKNDSRIIIMRHIEIGENVCGYTRAGGEKSFVNGSFDRERENSIWIPGRESTTTR